MHQELDHVKMTAVCRQPERGVPFLVPYIDMGTPAKTGRSVQTYTLADGKEQLRVIKTRIWFCTETAKSTHLLMSSSQNL